MSSFPPTSPATQNQVDEHDTERSSLPGSTGFGADHDEPLNVSASPPRPTAAQNDTLGQDTELSNPVASTGFGVDAVGHDTELTSPNASTSVGADHAEPEYVHASPATPTTTHDDPLAQAIEVRWLEAGELLDPVFACATVAQTSARAPTTAATTMRRLARARAVGDVRAVDPPRFVIRQPPAPRVPSAQDYVRCRGRFSPPRSAAFVAQLRFFRCCRR